MTVTRGWGAPRLVRRTEASDETLDPRVRRLEEHGRHAATARRDPAIPGGRLAPSLHAYPVEMAPSGDSRESLVDRALPIYLGLLFAVLTVVAVVLLFMVRHVLLVLFVSVLLASALTWPSEWLHRRFRLPLGLAAVVIYIACFAVIVGIGWIVVPPLLGQVGSRAKRPTTSYRAHARAREGPWPEPAPVIRHVPDTSS